MRELVIGIDVGGTNTEFGLVDRDGKIYGKGSISTQAHKYFEPYLDDLVDSIKKLIEVCAEDAKIVGVGIGAPNANYYTGIVAHAANLPWKGIIYFAKEISEKLDNLPAVITNDANAAAIGEMIYGGAKGMKNFVVVTLGTGVGSGIVVDGKLLYGHTGFAGEFGHTLTRSGGRECGCGRSGCLETYTSATGIKRTIFKLIAESNEPSILRDYSYNELTAKAITEAALENDHLAIKAFEYTGRILGGALANLVSITSPEAVFLFGGLANAGRFIFEPTLKSMDDSMLFVFNRSAKLLPSLIDEKNAAILGSSALAWQHIDEA